MDFLSCQLLLGFHQMPRGKKQGGPSLSQGRGKAEAVYSHEHFLFSYLLYDWQSVKKLVTFVVLADLCCLHLTFFRIKIEINVKPF